MVKNSLYLMRLITYVMMLCAALFVVLCGRIILMILSLLGAVACGFLLGIVGAMWCIMKGLRRYKRYMWRDAHECSCKYEW